MNTALFGRLVICGLLIAFQAISTTGCASDRSTIEDFPKLETDFSSYRTNVQAWLQARSMRHRTDAAIELNLPFELPADPDVPYQGRYLLLHGLNDSAYVWQDFAQALVSRGFDVRAVLFSGHGSTPEDMLEVQWESWLATARTHLAAWKKDDIPMHLGGFSMGGVLATWLALDNPDVRSLLLVSPAFESKLNHLLRWSGLYARFKPWVFGGMILEDNPIKYNSIPVNSGWQYYQLTAALKRRWGWGDRIDIPTLIVVSEDDSVVNIDYTRSLFGKRFVSEHRLMLTYSAQSDGNDTASSASSQQGVELTPFEIHETSYFPQFRVLNQSHLGLMNKPANPLFGRQAAVLVCNGNDYPTFMACMRSRQHWYGAQHTASPDGIPVARTTYNPDWAGVLQQFDSVIMPALK